MKNLLRYAAMLFCLACIPILTKAQCTVSAGSNINKCIYSMDSVKLQGTVAGNFTTYNWTTTGSGTVKNSAALIAYYKYNQTDITNGSVTLTLTASGGTCGSVTSQVIINFYKRPTVVISADELSVCGSSIPLTSTATDAASVQWRAMVGSGTFSSTTTTNTVYTTSVADRTQGFVLVEVQGSTALAGCFHQDTVRVNIVSVAIVDAGPDRTVCSHPHAAVFPIPNQTTGYTSYLWTTTGTGTFMNPNAFLTAYFLSAADQASGSVTITLTGTSATCGTASDSYTITVTPSPVVSAGADQTICGNTATLNGAVTPSSGAAIQWLNVIGDGSFSNTAILTPVYTPAATDQARGYALLRLYVTASNACVSEDTVQVNIAAGASLNAGADQTICAASGTTVNSTATSTPGYTAYLWTTSGTGTFSNPTALLSPYIFSPADIAAGSVTLTLTGNTGACGSTSDSRIITILQSPVVSAGVDKTICGNTTVLNGTVTPSSGTTFEWMGAGTFSNKTIPAPTYTISPIDITRGFALVRLLAISSQGCAKEDTLYLNISSAPIVFAGSNQVSCSGSVVTHGYAINATTKLWSTSGTGAFANTSKDTTTYVPSSSDRTSGQVILTYTGGNTCSSATSSTQINFIQTTPLVNAGIDETICGKDTIQLSGSVVNATGGTWTASGTGHFLLSPSHLVNLYKLSAADKIAGSVSFTLTSYNAGGCGAVSDVRTVSILSGSLPNVDAGADQVSFITAQLNATVSNATSQLWQTSGVGVFTPNPTSVNASYIPSADDITAGSVVLTLAATNSCGVTSDALTLFTATPSSISGTVKAGSNTLDHGFVYLFAVNDAQDRELVDIDTIYPSSNGVYQFPSVSTGHYNVYAVPVTSSAYAATYLATYLGSVTATAWEDAGQEDVTSGSAAHILNVDLVSYTSALPNWNTGIDTISGAVFLNTPIAIMRLAGIDDAPLAGVVVYLKTLNGQVITYTSTNKYGVYTFNNVLAGNYYIDTEYSYTDTFLDDKIVPVDGNPQTIEDGNVIVNRTTLTTGILSSNKSMEIHAYPNPTSDNIHLQLNKAGNYSVKVLDETGVVHVEQQLSVTSGVASEISLSGLKKGLYIIQITSEDEVYNTKVVKF